MAKLSLSSDKIQHIHNQNFLSPEMQGRGACPYHRNICCLLASISPSATEVQLQMPQRAAMKTTNLWKTSAQTSWGSILISSYTNRQEGSCFFILSSSVAESYFWTYAHIQTNTQTQAQTCRHTHTYPSFSSPLPSTHTFPWKEIRNHSLLQWAEQTRDIPFKNAVASLLQFSCPVLSRALPSNSGFLHRCQVQM